MTGVMMRVKALVAVMLSLSMMAMVVPAMAQEVPPEQLALARKYIDLTDRASIFEITMVEIGIGTMRQIVQQNPEISEQTDAAIGKILEEYRDRKGELLNQFARVYAARFSIEELQEIVAFYESETGQKLAKANTEVNADLQNVMQVFTNNVRPEFFAKVRAELRGQGIQL
ncbi:DUF2059 domain-containing protein [Devosia sp. J2-20]|jgi:uncharacterized protein|uniref:DUF2059 domain-containing protein n=1 Tax=Devosia litorisediminis TaxID=2829817 RepID=A0A942IDY2_9HYPH|nr:MULTISPECIES: DUF2059 domain-containing protein [Devosia]MBS3849069.1 DUF2059 domain-containing protein [Devosia litorisediminis]MCZ4344930.1 DUF2059 domain-containing protein [Devosia neptuniae]WDQ97861.1 DUF2059 domain-containing protein [Devosia sp. J2-20]|tara:strand:- start:85151 stop:85663 length:513 start_codon:yes stop_codon:yes gene_type:complete